MQVSMTFVGLGPQHSRPWFARIAGWPDRGPPVLAFGKPVKGSNPPECVVEAQAGDIVRWGIKDKTTGQADPSRSGFGIVSAGGGIVVCDKDEAQTARRRVHPEDAQLAPVAMGGGWKGGRGPKATGPAQAAATLGGSQAVHYAALLAATRRVVDVWNDPGGIAKGTRIAAAIQELAELMPGAAQAQADASEAQDAQTAAETAQEPEAPEVEEPEEIRPPAPLPVDEDGLPLF